MVKRRLGQRRVAHGQLFGHGQVISPEHHARYVTYKMGWSEQDDWTCQSSSLLESEAGYERGATHVGGVSGEDEEDDVL